MKKKSGLIVSDELQEKGNIPVRKIIIIILLILAIGIFIYIITQGKTQGKTSGQPVKYESGVLYGDVNGDNQVNSQDALEILKQIAEEKEDFLDKKLKVADVDGTGEVDQIDVQLILKKSSGLLKKFPIEEGKYGFKAGDVNQDTKITSQDALLIQKYIGKEKSLTVYQQVLADVSGNGTITELDAELILQYASKKIKSFPVIDPKVKYYTIGDVDQNDKITKEDALLIEQYLGGKENLSEIQLLAADVNEDGKITEEDAQKVLEICAGLSPAPETQNPSIGTENETTNSNNTSNQNSTQSQQPPATQEVPTTPSTPSVPFIYGDVNEDGNVTAEDASLILKFQNGSITLSDIQKQKADVTGEGAVNALDVELILRYAARRISELHPGAHYYTLGDVNENGRIDIQDVQLVQQSIAKLTTLNEVQKKAADYNQDGAITADDALLILKNVK